MGDPLTLTLCVEGSAPQGCPVVGECGDPPRGHMPPLGAFARWSGGGGLHLPRHAQSRSQPPRQKPLGFRNPQGLFWPFGGLSGGEFFAFKSSILTLLVKRRV